LPIRSIQIGGAFYYVSAEQVKKRIAPIVKGNFFTVNIRQIQESVRSHRWIEEVTIQRVWPDTLRIYIAEQNPVAYWLPGKLVNNKGQIFDGRPHSKLPVLPVFSGPKEYHVEMTKKYLAMKKTLSLYRLKVKKVLVTPRRAWKLVLVNGVTIKLGRQNIDKRLARLMSVYRGALANKMSAIRVIDMRYTNGFAVQWKTGSKNKNIAFGG